MAEVPVLLLEGPKPKLMLPAPTSEITSLLRALDRGLFRPDFLAGYDYDKTRRSTALTPCERLAFQALALGIQEFVNDCDRPYRNVRVKSPHLQAREWLESEDQDSEWGFESLCRRFHLDAGRVRTRLYELVAQHKKIHLFQPRGKRYTKIAPPERKAV